MISAASTEAVSVSQPPGEQSHIALRRYGVAVAFVRYPEGSHGFLRAGYPAHRADVLTRTVAWFREHLDVPGS